MLSQIYLFSHLVRLRHAETSAILQSCLCP
jgi:hypothetical protein